MYCLEEPRPLHPHLYLHPFHSHHSFSNLVQTYLHTPPPTTHARVPYDSPHVPIAALTVSIYVTLLFFSFLYSFSFSFLCSFSLLLPLLLLLLLLLPLLLLLLLLILLLLLLLLGLGLDDLRSLDNFSATSDARLSLVVSIHQRFPSISVDTR